MTAEENSVSARVINREQTRNVLVTPMKDRVLLRKCAYGGTPGPTGDCVECRRKCPMGDKPPLVQVKLRVSQSGERYEQEDEGETLQMKPFSAQITPLVQHEPIPDEKPGRVHFMHQTTVNIPTNDVFYEHFLIQRLTVSKTHPTLNVMNV